MLSDLDEPPSLSLLNILSDQTLLYFFITVVLLVFSGWTSAVEAAFFSLKPDDIERFRNSNDTRQKTAASLLANPRLLSSVLTTCKYSLLLAAAVFSIASFLWRDIGNYSDAAIISGVLALTMLFAILGVILPKIYGSTYNLAMATRNSKACRTLIAFVNPLVAPILRMSVSVERKLADRREQKSAEEFAQALQLAAIDNEPVEGERAILHEIVNFGSLTVRQVMRTTNEISYADVSLDFHELMDFVRTSGYSRVPVCRKSLDNIEGLLYIKDLLPFLGESASFAWQKLLRPAYYVQEGKKIDFLLKDFQEKRVHIALVVNQQGNTSGLITLEDIIEQIIGDINDEFDDLRVPFQRINDRTFLFDGKTSLHDFCRELHISEEIFYPVQGINESLNAVLLEINKGLPPVGEQIVVDGLTFVIESVHHQRIKKVRVHINEPAGKK